jgi:hypothetical protein
LFEPSFNAKVFSKMKFTRSLIVFLIMVMASSQALAAVCSISCADPSHSTHQQLLNIEMADTSMTNCHDNASSDEPQPSKHLNCSMAGCHFAQIVVPDLDVKGLIPILCDSALPQFISTAISADQPPPIKPPA